jgi:hypothetical protein
MKHWSRTVISGIATLALAICLGLSGNASAAPPSLCVQPPNTTMVAWYPFDELTGTTSINLATRNDGTQVNGPLGIAGGKVAGAASFNGIDQYVSSPSSIVTNFGPGQYAGACFTTAPNPNLSGGYSTCQGNFSIDTWVQVDPSLLSRGVYTIVDKRTSTTLPDIHGYAFYLYDDPSGKIHLGLQLADGVGPAGYTNYQFVTPVLPDTNWHHIAVTVDRRLATGIAWYNDGAQIGTSNPTGRIGSLVNTSSLFIGENATANQGDNKLLGNLDELEIFNRVLSPQEVSGIFKAGPSGKCKSTPH